MLPSIKNNIKLWLSGISHVEYWELSNVSATLQLPSSGWICIGGLSWSCVGQSIGCDVVNWWSERAGCYTDKHMCKEKGWRKIFKVHVVRTAGEQLFSRPDVRRRGDERCFWGLCEKKSFDGKSLVVSVIVKLWWESFLTCEISSSHGSEYDVQSCVLGYTAV
jgi:hypothetical protein